MPFILFVFGLAVGSFLNVVALRYDGEHFLFDPKVIGGRSRCPHCGKTLRWFELVPLVSFIAQGGKCRSCKARIGWQYPIVELLSGIIFAAVPLRFAMANQQFSTLPVLWTLVFEVLLLLSYIDILLGIIPDELNIALLLLGFANIFLASGFRANAWIDHAIAGTALAAFFGALVAVTRGRGMGVGDVKLALPLGFLFGWPAVLLVAAFAFVIGGAYGATLIATGAKTMKSAVPFGPFLAIGAAAAFFLGPAVISWYLRAAGL